MSIHVSTLIWKIDMPMPTKLVMLKLADNANEDGSNVRPSQATVARQCGCSVRTVQRVVSEQVEAGILIEVPTPGNRVNEYRFDMDAVRQRVTLTESHPDRESCLSTTESQASTTESHPINKNRHLTVKEPSSKKCDDFAGAECPPDLYDSAVCWQAYRKERKLPTYVKATWETKFKKYRGRDSDFARDVSFSIEQGYNGIFAPRTAQPGNRGSASTRDASEVRLV